MKEKTLSQILSDGTLVDNTIHTVRKGVHFARSGGEEMLIQQGTGKHNNPDKIWDLLQKSAMIRTESSKLILLAERADYEHNTDDPFISVRGSDVLNFSLSTGNLIGCVKSEKQTLKVTSRFGDDFLQYIIADADGFLEVAEQGGSKKGGYEWLLVYLWFVKLKKAFRLGLPKMYSTRTEELTQPRGRLDPIDYFLYHTRATYRCTYREHRYDNAPTRLIARALEHLESHDIIRDARTLNQTFQVASQGAHSSLQDLLATKPIANPYFGDYNPVINLSKRILRNQFADFGDQDESSTFFFDVSMLFEYFVRKLLKRTPVLFHSKNMREWSIPSGLSDGYEHRRLIPDLVFEIEKALYVFDVKYKSFDFKYGVSREDLFQLHTYIGQATNDSVIGGCGFIYPIRESRWASKNLDLVDGIFSRTITQAGRSVPFHVAFIKVPETQSGFLEFRDAFGGHLKRFVSSLLERLVVSHRKSASNHAKTNQSGRDSSLVVGSA
jgi:5-methylcytosine-specific restriction enzyme subunit McrC